MKITVDDRNVLEWRDTPWDTAAFGFSTSEITGLTGDSPEALRRLLERFDASNRARGVRFTYTRVEAKDTAARTALLQAGYYFAEVTYRIALRQLQKAEPARKAWRLLPLSVPAGGDFDQIRRIAHDDFHHGRFHEDPAVAQELARRRYANWIANLVEQGRDFLQYKAAGTVQGFFASRVEGEEAEIILSGCRKGHPALVVPFFGSVLEEYRSRGARRVETVISAANIGVMNVYNHFGFKYDRVLQGFHKWYGY